MSLISHDRLGVKTVNPSNWPQFPFNEPPKTPEQSKPMYTIDESETRIPMRDGIKLAADIYRPSAYGQKFPALLATSPYSRQMQRTNLPNAQNESGVTQFWVPRGYAHIIVDVRGTNDSEGSWDMMGPQEQQDLFDLIEWVAQQPWCDGNVGMTGASYFGWSQLNAATQQPPHLKAIFAFEASTDLYRDSFFHGGILSIHWANAWFDRVWKVHRNDSSHPNIAPNLDPCQEGEGAALSFWDLGPCRRWSRLPGRYHPRCGGPALPIVAISGHQKRAHDGR